MFRDHPQTPLDEEDRAAFRGVSYYPYDPALRFVARLRPAEPVPTLELPGGSDGVIILHPFAVTEGLAAGIGQELTLFWISGYAGGAFLPYTDRTSGKETYAGGRYLLDTVKGADLGAMGDGVILDFNFSYYPSCAYSPRWICPLAPAANRLPVAIHAGERNGPAGPGDARPQAVTAAR
jgi:uncharacterized protein (DUF1684 family)